MVEKPKSMSELTYYTFRSLKGKKDGKAKVWVFKATCSKCKKGKMSKPVDPKTGKPKTRAKELVCENCGFTEDKNIIEDQLIAGIEYTCPECGHQAEKEVPFKRKKVQLLDPKTGKKKSADALVFECDNCGFSIKITKKMKQ